MIPFLTFNSFIIQCYNVNCSVFIEQIAVYKSIVGGAVTEVGAKLCRAPKMLSRASFRAVSRDTGAEFFQILSCAATAPGQSLRARATATKVWVGARGK